MLHIKGTVDEDSFGGELTVDGRTLKLDDSLAIYNHSPAGFSWGYAGSGPAQSALGILLAAGLAAGDAVRLHQAFKRDFLVPLEPGYPFELDVDLDEWVAKMADPELLRATAKEA